MPDYVAVYLDDVAKTYIALPCIAQWHEKPTKTFDLVRLSNAREARRLGYEGDNDCRDAGGFMDDGGSVTEIVLIRLGLMAPLQHWWDRPYRTETGQVVYPAPHNPN